MSRRSAPVTDLHVYGGAVLVSIGLSMWTVWAGPVAFGTILLLLGLRRP